MKIAFVTHALSSAGGGVSTVVEALSGALADRGQHEVRVLGLLDGAWLDQQASWTGAPPEAFPTLGPASIGFAPGLARALTAFAPDFVHTHGIWMHPSAMVANWARSGKPYLVSPHGMLDAWALRTSRLKKAAARRLFEDRHLRGAACLHALNGAEAEAIRSSGLTSPIATVPNGVALPGGPPTALPAWTDTFGLEAKVLLFLGRLHPKKNVEGLLRAAASLKAESLLGDWRLAIAGWGTDRHVEILKTLTGDLGLGDVITFTGPLGGEDKSAALHHASAFILPSHSEGLPMAVLEAWAHGLPVAMTSACNLPEGFKARAAFEVDSDPPALAAGLAEFLSTDSRELDAMGQEGRRLVERKFSWDKVADSFIEVYDWILNGGSSPSCVMID